MPHLCHGAALPGLVTDQLQYCLCAGEGSQVARMEADFLQSLLEVAQLTAAMDARMAQVCCDPTFPTYLLKFSPVPWMQAITDPLHCL